MAKRELKTKPEEIIEAEVTEAAPAKEPKKPVYGKVANCKKLNVRKDPKKDGKVVKVIDEGMKVSIDLDASTDEYYKVTLPGGVYGFCKKEFIYTKA